MKINKNPRDAYYRILWDFDHPDFVRLCDRLDPEKFIKQIVSAGFDCVNFFAKDSLGQSLYPTAHGFQHPGLTIDFLGLMTRAAKAAGLTVLAYYNGTQDPYHARLHPDWAVPDKVKGSCWYAETNTSLSSICLHSRFLDDVMIPQLKEVASLYPVDGFFLDICCEAHCRPQCHCPACVTACRAELGMEIPSPADDETAHFRYEQWRRQAHQKIEDRIAAAIHSVNPKLSLTINYAFSARQPEQPRNMSYLSLDVDEPYNALLGTPSHLRYANHFDMPMEIFLSDMQHWWWDWDTRPMASMQLQAAETVANGGMVCVGSNLHPSGEFIPDKLAQWRELNEFLKQREPFCRDARPIANVAALHTGSSLFVRNARQRSYAGAAESFHTFRGAARILLEGHVPFQFIGEEALLTRASDYDLLVLPEQEALSDHAVQCLYDFVARGGRLLAIGRTAERDENGKIRPQPALNELLGIKTNGYMTYACGYGLFRDTAGASWKNPLLLEGEWVQAKAIDATVLADLLAPYHGKLANQTYDYYGVGMAPPSTEVAGHAVTIHPYQKGVAAFIAGQVCTQYGLKTQKEWRQVMLWLIQSLLPRKLIETDAPPMVEVVLTRQRNRVLCHYINYANEKGYSTRQLADYVPPIYDVKTILRLGDFHKATCYPEGIDLPLASNADGVSFSLPRLDIHNWVVLE